MRPYKWIILVYTLYLNYKTVDRSQTSLGPKKLVGPCAARESKEEKLYRKAINSGIFHTHCPYMKPGAILCNKCYCAIVEP